MTLFKTCSKSALISPLLHFLTHPKGKPFGWYLEEKFLKLHHLIYGDFKWYNSKTSVDMIVDYIIASGNITMLLEEKQDLLVKKFIESIVCLIADRIITLIIKKYDSISDIFENVKIKNGESCSSIESKRRKEMNARKLSIDAEANKNIAAIIENELELGCHDIDITFGKLFVYDSYAFLKKISNNVSHMFDQIEFIIIAKYIEIAYEKRNNPEAKKIIENMKVFLKKLKQHDEQDTDLSAHDTNKYVITNDISEALYKYLLYVVSNERNTKSVIKNVLKAAVSVSSDKSLLELFKGKNKLYYFPTDDYVKIIKRYSIELLRNKKSALHKGFINVLTTVILEAANRKYPYCFADLSSDEKNTLKEEIRKRIEKIISDNSDLDSDISKIAKSEAIAKMLSNLGYDIPAFMDIGLKRKMIENIELDVFIKDLHTHFEKDYDNYENIRKVKTVELSSKMITGIFLLSIGFLLLFIFAKITGTSLRDIKHPFNVKKIFEAIRNIDSTIRKIFAIILWIISAVIFFVLLYKLGKALFNFVLSKIKKH